jgi:parvulin-like peptidyl-prolyl isomerase
MMSFLRKHRTWLMSVIAILSIPFIFYFVQKPDYGAMHSGVFTQLYNRSVTLVEAQKSARLHDLAEILGIEQLAQTLSSGAQSRDDVLKYFAINLIILRHEADQLGIEPTQAEKVDFIRNLRAFQGPSGFDAKKYGDFADTILPANGFSDAQIEELAGDAICLERIRDLVGTGLAVPDSESKSNYEQAHGKLFVQAIRIRNADFAKEVKISDDDVRKYFDAHKNELKTEEKRKVEFVTFALTDEQKKLTGKERIEPLQKLADRANEFTAALAEKGAEFHQVATKMQLPVKATGEFTAAAPDPQLKSDPQLATTAFQLTPQEPNSEPVQTPEGFYVLHLAGVAESRPLTIEEAKDKIVDLIKSTRTREMAMNKGRQAVQDLRETLRSGAPLKFALEKANVKAEPVPPFTLMEAFDPSEADKKKEWPPDFMAIKNAAAQSQPGDVSDFIPWEEGGVIVYVEKREPPDEAKYRAEKASFDERYLRNKRQIVFEEWLRDRQLDAGLTPSAAEPVAPPRGGKRPQPAAPPVRKS